MTTNYAEPTFYIRSVLSSRYTFKGSYNYWEFISNNKKLGIYWSGRFTFYIATSLNEGIKLGNECSFEQFFQLLGAEDQEFFLFNLDILSYNK